MATAVESARIGIAKYLVPFAFVYNPSLLFEGPGWLTVISTAFALVGMWGLSVMLEGWHKGRISMPVRTIVGLSSLALLFPPQLDFFDTVPGYAVVTIGLACLVVVLTMQNRSRQTVNGRTG